MNITYQGNTSNVLKMKKYLQTNNEWYPSSGHEDPIESSHDKCKSIQASMTRATINPNHIFALEHSPIQLISRLKRMLKIF